MYTYCVTSLSLVIATFTLNLLEFECSQIQNDSFSLVTTYLNNQ